MDELITSIDALTTEAALELSNGVEEGEEVVYSTEPVDSTCLLVNYKRLSPNCSAPRTHKIDTITIHCMAGNLTVEGCGACFAERSRKASSNYGIGSDGRIALYVEEANRSWCSSSSANDNRAVTIEVANTVAAEPWPVSDKAYASLLNLVTDICRRNGIRKLLWRGDKSLIGQVDKQNMTVHRWFAAKACPGDYLYRRMGDIASEVNRQLGEQPGPSPTPPTPTDSYVVQVTASVLEVREGPGTNFSSVGEITDRGLYTIVAESDGTGASKWGKLKSGAGWISLDYCRKI